MRRTLTTIRAGAASIARQGENLLLALAFFGGLGLLAAAAALVATPLGLAVGGLLLAGLAGAYVRGKTDASR